MLFIDSSPKTLTIFLIRLDKLHELTLYTERMGKSEETKEHDYVVLSKMRSFLLFGFSVKLNLFLDPNFVLYCIKMQIKIPIEF